MRRRKRSGAAPARAPSRQFDGGCRESCDQPSTEASRVECPPPHSNSRRDPILDFALAAVLVSDAMPFVTADSHQSSYDVIVVGSGAAGGQSAYTLCMEGARVLMLE